MTALPSFLVAGFQKCGTHWVASNLREHPRVFMPERELHFFDDDRVHSNGGHWYSNHFADADDNLVIGERTPNYLTAPKAASRIRSLIPHVRLIVTMRDPVDRAVSALYHHIQKKRYPLRVGVEKQLLELLAHGDDHYGTLSFGRYCDHLEHYLESFPYDRFLFLVLEEDILEHKDCTMERMCRFLNIESDFVFPNTGCIENRGLRTPIGLFVSRLTVLDRRVGYRVALAFERFVHRSKPAISNEARCRLLECFLPTIERLERIIKRDLACWKSP